MLGRLAKWLRIFGYDTRYVQANSKTPLATLLHAENRTLLTRCRETLERCGGGVFIRSDHVQEQLRQLMEEKGIRWDPDTSFQRCPVCNERLRIADPDAVKGHVPEYVLFQHGLHLRRCPRCGRTYWRGTHPERMREQMKAWGLRFESGSGER